MFRIAEPCPAVGQSNGIQRVWLNGKQVFSRTNVKYTKKNRHYIEKLAFQNFHGGKSAKFKPSKTQHIW
jgi:hypothetical protein